MKDTNDVGNASNCDPETQKLLPTAEQAHGRKVYGVRKAMITGGVLFVVVFGYIGWVQSGVRRHDYSASCLHALGGGAIGSRGELLHYNPRCTDELKEYFQADYFYEVQKVADEAMDYFRQQIAAQDAEGQAGPRQLQQQEQQQGDGAASVSFGSRGTVIFDIDETALSNMDGFFPPSLWERLTSRGAAAAPVCARPHLDFVRLLDREQQQRGGMRHGGCRKGGMMGQSQQEGQQQEHQQQERSLQEQQQQQGQDSPHRTGAEAAAAAVLRGDATAAAGAAAPRQPLCSSPPLQASLQLYNFLLDNNYTVVFLTGRSEDARTDTEANLAEAGYGTSCAAAADADAHDDSRRLQQQQQQQQAGERCWMGRLWDWLRGAPAVPAVRSGRRCYAELIMREVGDDRLASVFKAEARASLVASGRLAPLAGNIGDQFSDLTGQAAAPASWKLPNPVYTLL